MADLERLGQFPANALGQRPRLDLREAERLDDGELVAAEASDEVRRADERQQAVGDALEQHIAEGMTVGVVDELEPIEIDDVQRVAALQAAAREKSVEMLAELAAIGERREGVVAREIENAGLRPVTPDGDRNGGEKGEQRGPHGCRIIAVAAGPPAGVVRFVRDRHDDLERGGGDRPLDHCQSVRFGAALVSRACLRRRSVRRRGKGLSDPVGEYAGACQKGAIVADEGEAASRTEIEIAVIARQPRGVERDCDHAGEAIVGVGQLARELDGPLPRRLADQRLADEKEIPDPLEARLKALAVAEIDPRPGVKKGRTRHHESVAVDHRR